MALAVLEETLPAEQREAAQRAIAAAFPGQPVESLVKMTVGLSGAGVYQLVVAGKPYVLRVETNRGGLWDPERQYACMRTAAEAGVAPTAIFVDPANGIAITAFIDATPLMQVERGTRCEALAKTLRTLHATPVFPAASDMFAGLDGIWAAARAAQAMPSDTLERFHERFRQVRAAYPAPTEPPVSGHNDVNPTNVLFEGERAWLVDWEMAAAADRFFDLATAGHWFCSSDAEETALLSAYFGRQPDEREWARYTLMQHAIRLIQGLVFIMLVARQQPGWRLPVDDLDIPTLAEFRPRMREAMGTPDGRAHFGWVCMHEACRASEGPRYEALQALFHA